MPISSIKNAGTSFGVTTGVPATYDEAGYAALTYTDADACEIISYDGENATWTTEEDDTYCLENSAPTKLKRQLGEIPFTLKFNKDSTAFYAIMEAAEKDQNQVLSVRIAKSDGTSFHYYSAQVNLWNEKFGDASGSVTVDASFLQQTETIKVSA